MVIASINKRTKILFSVLIVLSAIAGALKESRAFIRQKFELVAASVFRVSDIELSGEYRLSADEIARGRLSTANVSLFAALSDKKAKELVNNPWIENVEVRRQVFPARVELKVREVEPWLVAQIGERRWVVSKRGELVQPLDAITNQNLMVDLSELPRLEILPGRNADNLDNSELRFKNAVGQLKLLNAAGSFPYPISEYKVHDDGVMELIPEELERYPRVLLSVENFKNAETLISQLKSTLSEIARSAAPLRVSEIDLRFAGQAVVR